MAGSGRVAIGRVLGRERLVAARPAVAAVGGALVTGALVFLLLGVNPVTAYGRMLEGIVGSRAAWKEYLTEVTPLLVIGLGLAVCFRARVWNIGAEGQFVAGALTGGAVAIGIGAWPTPLALPVALLAGCAGGAIAGYLVGVLKARWEVNEIITSLLLNIVIGFAYSYAIRRPLRDPETFVPQSAPIPESVRLPDMPGISVHAGLLIGLVLIPLIWHLVRNTPFGFRVRLLGDNRSASVVSGVRDRLLIVKVLALSGAMAGLAGVIQILGVQYRLVEGISPGYGFTAIIVALIGRLRPLGVLFGAAVVAAFTVGGDALQRFEEVPAALMDVLTAVLIIFVVIARRR